MSRFENWEQWEAAAGLRPPHSKGTEDDDEESEPHAGVRDRAAPRLQRRAEDSGGDDTAAGATEE